MAQESSSEAASHEIRLHGSGRTASLDCILFSVFVASRLADSILTERCEMLTTFTVRRQLKRIVETLRAFHEVGRLRNELQMTLNGMMSETAKSAALPTLLEWFLATFGFSPFKVEYSLPTAHIETSRILHLTPAAPTDHLEEMLSTQVKTLTPLLPLLIVEVSGPAEVNQTLSVFGCDYDLAAAVVAQDGRQVVLQQTAESVTGWRLFDSVVVSSESNQREIAAEESVRMLRSSASVCFFQQVSASPPLSPQVDRTPIVYNVVLKNGKRVPVVVLLPPWGRPALSIAEEIRGNIDDLGIESVDVNAPFGFRDVDVTEVQSVAEEAGEGKTRSTSSERTKSSPLPSWAGGSKSRTESSTEPTAASTIRSESSSHAGLSPKERKRAPGGHPSPS